MNGEARNSNSAAVSPNFSFLAEYDELLCRSAVQAERYLFDDPNISLYKLRQFGDLLAREVAARTGVDVSPEDTAVMVLRKIEDRGVLPSKAAQLFHSIRRTGNRAVHEMIGDRGDALYHLRMARELAVWFHKTFGKKPALATGPFIPPPDPKEAEVDLTDELERLRKLLEDAQKVGETEAERRREAETRAKAMYDELAAAMSLAEETEDQLIAEKKRFEAHIASLQAETNAKPSEAMSLLLDRAHKADDAIDLNEADTRRLIDEQLRDAGWTADTPNLTYKKGIRPQKGKHIAIAEWPVAKSLADTEKTPKGNDWADYVLFEGLTAVAVVEAKRKNKDVAGSIEQAKRYSRGFKDGDGWGFAGGPWGNYRVPFLFATNGRPFLRQLLTKSGIWFLDARIPANHPHPLESWYTPEGLKGLLGVDVKASEAKLEKEPTDYLGLREYQVEAIQAVERAIARGDQTALLAMATGTGKTRTCIGLSYRLLKAKRFRRILFLVDRTSLGEQAAGAFRDVKLENLQSFNDIYDVKELGDIMPETDTRLHIATIQGMIRRLLFPAEDTLPLPVDLYDCVIVDECHRGYALDREMTEGELVFRSEQDYISKYTRVLDHFDAVKIGLTATPALHTTQIFGVPVYTYSYRQAVIEGYLIDHEPPIRIVTKLADGGITWKKGDAMDVYRPKTHTVDTAFAPDDVTIEVDKFNTAVLTDPFNETVCAELACHIDPTLPGKTLIFCATDNHADTVVNLLKKAFEAQYGQVDDDAVVKITAAADKPLDKIRHYKYEKYPSVVVTVDLLTTGIDVPAIVNIVFIRRVKSRILYEQMLGRATRRCDEIGKELFRIFDAVDLYAALEPHSSMRPVVPDPKITFAQLVTELSKVGDEDHRREIREQIVAKLQRKRRLIEGEEEERFRMIAGTGPAEALKSLRKMTGTEAKDWFCDRPDLAKYLDELKGEADFKILVSNHEDELKEVIHGFGDHQKPRDYLESFGAYIRENMNRIPALLVVTTRPRNLTRQQLRELKLLLDTAGYTEPNLRAAWKDTTNEDIAASIIGFIRRMVLGSPLVPYAVRVDLAMSKILTSRSWTEPQRKWLERIGNQLRVETVVDRAALDSGQFRAQGGFNRLNRIFDGKMEEVLGEISDTLWQDEAVA
ncbi:MAG: type I restriction-modification system endonuclease [Pseudomonadota bacterium]